MEKYVEFPSLIWKNLPRAFVLIEILDKPIKRTWSNELLKRIWNESSFEFDRISIRKNQKKKKKKKEIAMYLNFKINSIWIIYGVYKI